eukprot:322233_1
MYKLCLLLLAIIFISIDAIKRRPSTLRKLHSDSTELDKEKQWLKFDGIQRPAYLQISVEFRRIDHLQNPTKAFERIVTDAIAGPSVQKSNVYESEQIEPKNVQWDTQPSDTPPMSWLTTDASLRQLKEDNPVLWGLITTQTNEEDAITEVENYFQEKGMNLETMTKLATRHADQSSNYLGDDKAWVAQSDAFLIKLN